jgi:hypothetical protein
VGRLGVKGLALVVSLLAVGAMALPAGAAANLVVNGDFETGNLTGWHVKNEPGGTGSWFAYTGTEDPEEPSATVPPPPQGNFAAIASQNNPGSHILYQDVALGAGPHELSLIAYYESFTPIVSPETLSPFEETNQQYRIDVLKPGASLTTVNPEDIIATLLHTEEGDPELLEPEILTADLSAYAGQTVRLRFAETDTVSPFHAGVDAVSISGSAPPPPPAPAPPAPSNVFTFGYLKLNKTKGTATLKVNVPGAGALKALDVKKKGKRIKKATATASAAGVATLTLKPTAAGMKALKKNGKLPFGLSVTFTPTGGTAASKIFSGKLKLKKPKS